MACVSDDGVACGNEISVYTGRLRYTTGVAEYAEFQVLRTVQSL